MIARSLEYIIKSKFGTEKAIIVLGPRHTGKTTLLQLIADNRGDYLLLDCDDPIVRDQLENANTSSIKQIIGKHDLVLIDEAQRVKNIGITLKIITDRFNSVQLLVSGSSSLDIRSEINEPLTGRKWEYMLYPLSWGELHEHYGHLEMLKQLETRIIYGMYPDVINKMGNEKEVLKQLSDSYLYKDLLSYKGIRKPELLNKLLTALALQIGNEVSYNELASMLQVDKNTVSNYIDLLEKAFIVFRLQPFKRNMRSEISKSRKIYFYDTGIRNAIIANFKPLNFRNDSGALWENFLISERIKYLHYSNIWANSYFWRTKQQQEIDYVEEKDGKIFAWEIKLNPTKRINFPKSFLEAYPDSETAIISRENFMTILLRQNR